MRRRTPLPSTEGAASGTEITGLDFDTWHIEYAREKSMELNLQCYFVAGDATQLPFEDNMFDVCYSHTVMNFCEPGKFVDEQYRSFAAQRKRTEWRRMRSAEPSIRPCSI